MSIEINFVEVTKLARCMFWDDKCNDTAPETDSWESLPQGERDAYIKRAFAWMENRKDALLCR